MGRNMRGFTPIATAAAIAIAVLASNMALGDDPKPDKSVKPDMTQVPWKAGAASPVAKLPSPPANGEMTFVFSDLSPLIYPGWEACPTGWAHTNKEEYLTTVSAAERARLMKPENEPELTTKWKASTNGPDNTKRLHELRQVPGPSVSCDGADQDCVWFES